MESVLALQEMSVSAARWTPGGLENGGGYELTFGEFNLQMDSCLGQLMLLVTVEAPSWSLKS